MNVLGLDIDGKQISIVVSDALRCTALEPTVLKRKAAEDIFNQDLYYESGSGKP